MNEEYIDSILKLVAQGDNQAFARLYDLFYLRVYRYAGYFIRSREDREEVVSEVFRIIWQNRHLLIGVRNFESYIYVVTRNEAFRILRGYSRYRNISIDEMPVELVLSQPDVESALADDEMMALYADAIGTLPERCKLIFLMVREQRMKYKDVAEILAISEGTVERQINIAIKKIVDILRRRLPNLLAGK